MMNNPLGTLLLRLAIALPVATVGIVGFALTQLRDTKVPRPYAASSSL